MGCASSIAVDDPQSKKQQSQNNQIEQQNQLKLQKSIQYAKPPMIDDKALKQKQQEVQLKQFVQRPTDEELARQQYSQEQKVELNPISNTITDDNYIVVIQEAFNSLNKVLDQMDPKKGSL